MVILGQDPYHGPNQAHGLSFSVNKGVDLPPSLKNIYKELETDLGLGVVNHGFLEGWALEGVLLLNNVLTVEHKNPGSHQNKGWEKFTDAVIDVLNDLCESRAINLVEGLSSVPLSSIKPITGHCLGASPALEAVLCVMVINKNKAPHTANLKNIDEKLKINPIMESPSEGEFKNVLSTSLGFWGNHASLVFSKIS